MPDATVVPYLVAGDLVTYYGEGELDEASDALIAQELQAATELINNILKAGKVKYALPLSPPPPLIKGICADLARVKIAAGQRIYDEQRYKPLKELRDDAVKLLDKIAASEEPMLDEKYLAVPEEEEKAARTVWFESRPRRRFNR